MGVTQGFTNQVVALYRATSMATVANTVTQGTIIGSSANPLDSLTIPANSLIVGKTFRFVIRGLYSTATLSAGNLTLTDKFGTTTLASYTVNSTLLSALLGQTNQGFDAILYMTCYTTGTTGSMMVMGSASYTTSTGTPMVIPLNNGTSTIAINTTIDNVFSSSVQWSGASASNTITSMVAFLEMLN